MADPDPYSSSSSVSSSSSASFSSWLFSRKRVHALKSCFLWRVIILPFLVTGRCAGRCCVGCVLPCAISGVCGFLGSAIVGLDWNLAYDRWLMSPEEVEDEEYKAQLREEMGRIRDRVAFERLKEDLVHERRWHRLRGVPRAQGRMRDPRKLPSAAVVWTTTMMALPIQDETEGFVASGPAFFLASRDFPQSHANTTTATAARTKE